MKKVKLMFGLLLVVLFVSTIVLSVNPNNEQAWKKGVVHVLPPNG